MPEAIVRKYSREIFGYLCRFTGSAMLAEELLGDVYVRLIEQYSKVRDVSFEWRPWLYRVATNVAISNHRRQKIRGMFGITKKEVNTNHPLPDSILETDEQGEKVRAAIEKLGAKHRAVVLLKFYQEMSYEDMAEVLKINIGTVKSRLNVAKSKIEGLLLGEI